MPTHAISVFDVDGSCESGESSNTAKAVYQGLKNTCAHVDINVVSAMFNSSLCGKF